MRCSLGGREMSEELAAALELGKEGDLLHRVQGALTGGGGPILGGVELEGDVYAFSFAVPRVVAFADLCEVGVCTLFFNALAMEGNCLQAKVGLEIPAAGSEVDSVGVGAENRLKGGLLPALRVLLP